MYAGLEDNQKPTRTQSTVDINLADNNPAS